MGDLSEKSIVDLVARISQARAGEFSIFGLFALIDALEPVPALLAKARKKQDEGLTQLDSAMRAALESDKVLSKAPTEMKKMLAEELERAVSVNGITMRERTRALSFIEAQLKVASKEESEVAVARCAKLREKRFQLESCGIVKESAEVHRLEKHCKELNAEFSAVAGAYESWQAGRSKFKSNEQLQSAKRRYETLTKQIASSTQDLETALCQRRKVNNVAEIVASPSRRNCLYRCAK